MKWIPVSERLPEGDGKIYATCLEESKPVLVYGECDGMCGFGIGRYIYDHEDIHDSGWNGCLDGDYDLGYCTVVAWMPLPKPYQEKEE